MGNPSLEVCRIGRQRLKNAARREGAREKSNSKRDVRRGGSDVVSCVMGDELKSAISL
jgi:hypothetical protein